MYICLTTLQLHTPLCYLQKPPSQKPSLPSCVNFLCTSYLLHHYLFSKLLLPSYLPLLLLESQIVFLHSLHRSQCYWRQGEVVHATDGCI